jgi:hypothetical protein
MKLKLVFKLSLEVFEFEKSVESKGLKTKRIIQQQTYPWVVH